MKKNLEERLNALVELRKKYTDEDIINRAKELGLDYNMVARDLRLISIMCN